jgi:hypothetical protein
VVHRLCVQVTVQVGSLTMQLAARDLEPLQGRQPAGGTTPSNKRQQRTQPRKRRKDSRREQEQQEQQGGVATIQLAANTVDVRGQRAIEVGLQMDGQ